MLATLLVVKNAQADPTQEAVSYYIIEQLKSLDDKQATFELASPAETDNAKSRY